MAGDRRDHCCQLARSGKGDLLTWDGARGSCVRRTERLADPLQVRGVTDCTWPVWPDTDVSVKGVGYMSRSRNTSVWLESNMKWSGTYVYFSFFSHSSATCLVIQ